MFCVFCFMFYGLLFGSVVYLIFVLLCVNFNYLVILMIYCG